MTPAVFGITGWKNSGKTTLVARLVTELRGRGLKVGVIKHAHHAFDIDHPGRDSHTIREAGANEVAIVSARRWALIHELRDGEPEPSLEDMLPRLASNDLVVVEGFKRAPHPKLEVRSAEAVDTRPMDEIAPNIVALAADDPQDDPRPHFRRDDISGIADFIIAHLRLAPDAANLSQI
ncbi:molybdopterin-guanine dinucleotide biosynthesis protein B [Dichotomicrobium thermohalophilum]|uniref:Molybdopterin guanine dinucleotide biosynthesis accessory protein MobB n=1 Tax=Dichotomicrobium thermohalophilum TaxID=933063 RepID=A0A397PJ54_9HYPH|nr:molybdopterin-guanine dinucleotide biosynthesis protein B [Dichotomicrobium thermohalophilum]RIA47197.1 molybdopterin guanine dinucleotide biosynthesis accessory protein MobB [Dichotomicrobium thermohalophilum]